MTSGTEGTEGTENPLPEKSDISLPYRYDRYGEEENGGKIENQCLQCPSGPKVTRGDANGLLPRKDCGSGARGNLAA